MEMHILIIMKKEVYINFLKEEELKDVKTGFHWTDSNNYCIEFSNVNKKQKEEIMDHVKRKLKEVEETEYAIIETLTEYRGLINETPRVNVNGKLQVIMNIKTELYLPEYKIINPLKPLKN